MRYSYDGWKCNARRRGKIFTITFEYFKEFCYRTEYMSKKGRTKTSYHIDCKIPELGYAPGNIQAITNTENMKKRLQWEVDQRGKPNNYRYTKPETDAEEDYPF